MIRLEEAVLVRFGKFKDYTLRFHDGLQVIYGTNEAGKSTLQLFLRLMLYGISGSKKDDRGMKARERAIPWEEKSAEGVLRLTVDERRLEIRRKFGKTPSGDRTEVLDANTGAELSEYNPKNLGETLLGVPETVFEKTFWLRQDGAAFSGTDAELSGRLMNLLESGTEDISAEKVFKELEKEIRAIKAKDKRSNPGRLDQLRDLHDEKMRERYQLRSEMEQRATEEEHLQVERQRLCDAETELERLRKLSEKKSWLSQMETRRKKWEQAEKMLELAKQAESREVYQNFQSLDEKTVQEAENLEKRLETLDQTLRIEYDKEKIEDRMRSQQKKEQESGLGILLGILLLATGIVLSFLPIPLSGLWMLLCAGVALVFIGGSFVYMKRAKAKLRRFSEEKEHLLQETGNTLREREAVLLQYKTLLDGYSCQDAGMLRERFAECRQAALEAEGYRRARASLLEGENIAEMPGIIEQIDRTVAQHQDLLSLDIDSAIQREQEKQIASLAAIKELEAKMAYVFRDTRSPADLQTEILQIEEEALALEKREKALELAISVFQGVYKKRKSDFTPQVNEKVNRFLRHLTDGKYQEVRVSEEYQLQILSDATHFYSAEYFSRGTYEQIYFALRLALGTLIGNGREPLFLDDFLMAYDDQRAKMAFVLLEELAKERQILLFTCHQRDLQNATLSHTTVLDLKEE